MRVVLRCVARCRVACAVGSGGGATGGIGAPSRLKPERWPRLLSIPLTFLIASLGWVFFRTADFHHAHLYFGQLFASVPHFASVDISAKVVTAGIIAAVFAFIGHTKMATRLVHFYSIPTARNSVVVAQFLSGFLLLVWSIGEIAAGGFNPFIYFRF